MKKKEIQPKPPSRRQLQHQQFAAHSASQAPVVIHLSNGTRLHGVVLASDDYALLLGRHPEEGYPTLVYKRAICLITPAGAPLAAEAPEQDPAGAPDFVPIYIPRTRRRR